MWQSRGKNLWLLIFFYNKCIRVQRLCNRLFADVTLCLNSEEIISPFVTKGKCGQFCKSEIAAWSLVISRRDSFWDSHAVTIVAWWRNEKGKKNQNPREKEKERERRGNRKTFFFAHDYYWNAFSDDVDDSETPVARLHRHVDYAKLKRQLSWCTRKKSTNRLKAFIRLVRRIPSRSRELSVRIIETRNEPGN